MSLPAAFVSVILIWSTTPLAIKWSAMDIGFSFAVFSRMVLGALLCVLLLAVLRVRFPLHRKARLSYAASGLSMFGAMSLTYWSSQYVSSGAALWLKEEAITPSKVAGMLLGVLGLALVFRGGFGLGDGAVAGVAALFAAVAAGLARAFEVGRFVKCDIDMLAVSPRPAVGGKF